MKTIKTAFLALAAMLTLAHPVALGQQAQTKEYSTIGQVPINTPTYAPTDPFSFAATKKISHKLSNQLENKTYHILQTSNMVFSSYSTRSFIVEDQYDEQEFTIDAGSLNEFCYGDAVVYFPFGNSKMVLSPTNGISLVWSKDKYRTLDDVLTIKGPTTAMFTFMKIPSGLGTNLVDNSQYVFIDRKDLEFTESRFILEDGSTEAYNIIGTLSLETMHQLGYVDIIYNQEDDEYEYRWNKKIKCAIIGNGVYNIESAFFNNADIQYVGFGSCVTNIGTTSFAYCENLKKIDIPDNVRNIGQGAFAVCQSLEEVTIPNSVVNIENAAFFNCSNLKDVVLPDSISEIKESVFNYCASLEQITIPDSVGDIGYMAFNFSGLKNVKFGNGVTNIDDYAFCNSLLEGNLVLPEGIIKIGYCSFEGNQIESLHLGESLESMDSTSFTNCTQLTQVRVPQYVCNNIFANLFDSCYQQITNITFSPNVSTIGPQSFINCIGLKDITIPNNIEVVGESAFSYCIGMTNATVNANNIDSASFSFCTNLTTVSIGSKKIGQYAFYQCSALKSAILGDDTETIEYGAFNKCSELENVHFGDSVKSIGNWAFSDCASLVEMALPQNFQYIGQGAFFNCSSLKTVTGLGKIKEIKDDTFRDCPSLESVDCFSTSGGDGILTNICDYAFYGAKFTRVLLPPSVKRIGNFAFANQTSLEEFWFGSVDTEIDSRIESGYRRSNTFQGSYIKKVNFTKQFCSTDFMYVPYLLFPQAEEITVMDGVTTINSYTIINSSTMKKLTIPASVTTIVSPAFGWNQVRDLEVIMLGKTKEYVSGMNGFSWGLSKSSGQHFMCTDGRLEPN